MQSFPSSRYVVRISEQQEVDLTKAREVRSNNLYPFGRHNYAIYRTPEGVFVKATNTWSSERMLDTYTILDEEEALNYRHPYLRKE
jgi:hypothetical protein